mmetsp:Transcript_13457/g.18810  ORF Transcript_13457/g.18810 Transcript_13457/m.18810 type:complete len:536 (-) Transcript_13457:556-2163(-)
MASTAMTDSKSPIPKYPTGPIGFHLFEEIGSGAFAKVYRAAVCVIDWKTFEANVKKAETIPENAMKKLEKTFKDRPHKLLELTVQSALSELFGEETPGSEEMNVVKNIIEIIKKSRKDTKENVAVKIIEAQHANWDDIRLELVTMRSMNHENVVRVHSAFVNELENDQELWIVMPFLAVGSCASVLRDLTPDVNKDDVVPKGIKDEKTLATILHKVLKALAYFHKDGRIHRDVKAGNILLSADGEVKLADFGVSANTIKHGSRENLRKTFVGTPCWMAPEVMEQRNGYNTKADIWSFGITAMELAYGYAPYAKEAAMKVLVLTLKDPPPTCQVYPDYNKPALPKSFHKMISKCLKKDPADRPEASKLIRHSFFKNVQDQKYLVQHLITGVLQQRSKEDAPKKLYSEERNDGEPSPPKNNNSYELESFQFTGKILGEIREERDKIKEEKNKQSENGDNKAKADNGGDGEKRGRFTVKSGGEEPTENKRGRFTIVKNEVAASVKVKGRFTVKTVQESPNDETQPPANTGPVATPAPV